VGGREKSTDDTDYADFFVCVLGEICGCPNIGDYCLAGLTEEYG
jgi:hypothetical protein